MRSLLGLSRLARHEILFSLPSLRRNHKFPHLLDAFINVARKGESTRFPTFCRKFSSVFQKYQYLYSGNHPTDRERRGY
jgi:hypothetical protein